MTDNTRLVQIDNTIHTWWHYEYVKKITGFSQYIKHSKVITEMLQSLISCNVFPVIFIPVTFLPTTGYSFAEGNPLSHVNIGQNGVIINNMVICQLGRGEIVWLGNRTTTTTTTSSPRSSNSYRSREHLN